MALSVPIGQPRFQAFDPDTNEPLVGGKVYTYAAGTTTPKATYADGDEVTTNANPVILDAAGSAAIYIRGLYKFIVYDADDNLIYEIDDVQSSSAGETGPTGPGIAAGGTAGQRLRKNSGTDYDTNWISDDFTLEVTFGNSDGIGAGIKGDLQIDFNCQIIKVTLLADQAGDLVVDIWRDSYINFPPVVADSICGAAKPTLSAAAKSQDSTLTGWSTTLSSGDILRFNVDSAATVTRVTLALTLRRL